MKNLYAAAIYATRINRNGDKESAWGARGVWADSEAEAIGIAIGESEKAFPPLQGWISRIPSVSLLDKEFLTRE